MRLPLTFVSIAALLFAGACVDDQASEQDYDDVAVAVGAMMSAEEGGEVGAMNDSIEVALGVSIGGAATGDGGGTITGSRGGLTYSYSIACKDASGNDLAQCDGTTDSASVAVDWAGSYDGLQLDAELNRSGDWTWTGLQSETATFNGTGSFQLESEFMAYNRPVMRTYELDYLAEYDGVQIRLADRTPIAGTITYDVAAERTATREGRADVEADFRVHVEVSFNGDGSANLVLDGSRNYRLELATGTVVHQGEISISN